VAKEAFKGALARPSAVAIHDNGYVLRNFSGVELTVDVLLLGGEFVKTGGNSIGRW
jgi:hypothetical protein